MRRARRSSTPDLFDDNENFESSQPTRVLSQPGHGSGSKLVANDNDYYFTPSTGESQEKTDSQSQYGYYTPLSSRRCSRSRERRQSRAEITPILRRSRSRDRSSSRSVSPPARRVRVLSLRSGSSGNEGSLTRRHKHPPPTNRRQVRAVSGAPKFHGKKWSTYVLRFEAYANLHQWTDEDKARILPTCLEEDTALTLQSKKSKTWSYEKLKEELNICYNGIIDEDELEKQICEDRQSPKNRTVLFMTISTH